MNTVSISFLVFLTSFLGVGIYSATRMKKSAEDYLVASREVHPWLVALSAVATNNSGFMFIGLIGSTFVEGLSSMWVMIGWVLGDYIAWRMKVPERLRTESERRGVVTIPSFIGQGLTKGRWVTFTAAIVTLIFLGIYSAAQLNAGGKALHTLFGWDLTVGAVLGAAIVVVYCFAGGIRASIWTDAAQSVVMIVSMLALFGACVASVGGFSSMWAQLESIDPNLIATFPETPQFGIFLFIIGWIFAGFGVVGQPHVMVRIMAVDSAENLKQSRRVYLGFNILLAVSSIGLGLAARAFLPELDTLNLQNVVELNALCVEGGVLNLPDSLGACTQANGIWSQAMAESGGNTDGLKNAYLWYTNGAWTAFDPELTMPIAARALMPEVVVGLCLAGLFAATMSTADSQILSCSAAITQDMVPQWQHSYVMSKIATICVALLSLSIALYAILMGGSGGGVFNLVVLAWAALAAGLGPMLLIRAFGYSLPGSGALFVIAAGVGGVMTWRYGLGLTSAIYDVLPGMACAFLVFAYLRMQGKARKVQG